MDTRLSGHWSPILTNSARYISPRRRYAPSSCNPMDENGGILHTRHKVRGKGVPCQRRSGGRRQLRELEHKRSQKVERGGMFLGIAAKTRNRWRREREQTDADESGVYPVAKSKGEEGKTSEKGGHWQRGVLAATINMQGEVESARAHNWEQRGKKASKEAQGPEYQYQLLADQ